MVLYDRDPMPHGQHEGTKMMDVPASYLLWLADNVSGDKWEEVLEYVERYREVLEKEVRDES